MSEMNEPAPASRRNPLIWIVLVIVGLILFVFLGGDRGDLPGKLSINKLPDSSNTTGSIESGSTENAALEADTTSIVASDDSGSSDSFSTTEETVGTIQRSLLVPPGMRARQYIEQLREKGKPYPLSQAFDKAQIFRDEGSLADAHLLLFFAARENHLPAMIAMGESSDPVRFRAQDSLLDEADAIQAYKWYRKAADLGQPKATQRLDELSRWASDAAASGDPQARQLLLNIQ